MPPFVRRGYYDDFWNVDKILARRIKPGTIGVWEYLVAWEGFTAEGDTWQQAHDIPKNIVKDYNSSYNLRAEMLLSRIRGSFWRVLKETKEALWNLEIEEHTDPETARAAMQLLAWQRGGLPPLELQTYPGDDCKQKLALALMSQESVADLVRMHELHPEAGVGNVRIRHGSGDKNLRVVSAPVVVEFVEPLPIDGLQLATGYTFKIKFSTWTFLNPTGYHDHPPAPDAEKLGRRPRDALVAHVKRLVKEPYATAASWPKGRVRRHALTRSPQPGVPAWADLPTTRWALTPQEAMPGA